MSLLLFVLSIVSLMYIWSTTYIMQPFRNLIDYIPGLKLINLCPSCTTWWLALLLSFKTNPLEGVLPPLISNIVAAAISFLAIEVVFSLGKSKCSGGCGGGK